MIIKHDKKIRGKCYGVVSSGNKIYKFSKDNARKWVKDHVKKGDKYAIHKTGNKYIVFTYWKGRIGNC